MFRVSDVEPEQVEHGRVERSFTVHIGNPKPMEPVNTTSGFALYERRLRVKIGYLLTERGDASEFEGIGEQSGPSAHDEVEDRADADGVRIRAVVGSFRNWSGLDGVSIIDVIPVESEGDNPALLGDRAVATHTFTVKSRDALPGAYGPSL